MMLLLMNIIRPAARIPHVSAYASTNAVLYLARTGIHSDTLRRRNVTKKVISYSQLVAMPLGN
jgi:hypothetical protein